MKFAKYWEKIELPVEEKLFERSSISIWGASNESREDALKHAQSRVEDFQRVFKNGFSRLRRPHLFSLSRRPTSILRSNFIIFPGILGPAGICHSHRRWDRLSFGESNFAAGPGTKLVFD